MPRVFGEVPPGDGAWELEPAPVGEHCTRCGRYIELEDVGVIEDAGPVHKACVFLSQVLYWRARANLWKRLAGRLFRRQFEIR